jgi:hypothetical protein
MTSPLSHAARSASPGTPPSLGGRLEQGRDNSVFLHELEVDAALPLGFLVCAVERLRVDLEVLGQGRSQLSELRRKRRCSARPSPQVGSSAICVFGLSDTPGVRLVFPRL